MSFLSHSLSHSTCFVFFTPRAFFPLSLSLSHFLSSSHLLPSSLSFVLDPLSLAVFHTLSFFFENEFPLFLSFIFPSPSVFSSLPFILRHPLLPLLFSLVLRRPCLLQNPATKSAMPSSKSNKSARDISPPLGFLERCPLLFLSRRMASGLVRSALTSAMMSHAVWRNATTTTSTNCIRRSGLGLINTASIMGTQGEDARRGFKTAVNNYNVLYSADSDAAAAKNSAEGTRMEKANTRDTRTHTYMTETTGNGGGGIWTRK